MLPYSLLDSIVFTTSVSDATIEGRSAGPFNNNNAARFDMAYFDHLKIVVRVRSVPQTPMILSDSLITIMASVCELKLKPSSACAPSSPPATSPELPPPSNPPFQLQRSPPSTHPSRPSRHRLMYPSRASMKSDETPPPDAIPTPAVNQVTPECLQPVIFPSTPR